MNWVRSKARKLSLLALFALAVQLGLSFGHVHAATFGHGSAQTLLTNAPLASTSIPDHDQDGYTDACAICATIAMANTLIDAAPPALPLPAQVYAAPLAIPDLPDTAQPHRFFFRSRAPPRS